MPIDATGLPIGGSLFVVVAGYAAVSLMVSGPTLGGRIIERDGWMGRCEKAIVRSATQDKPELKSVPQIPDCNSIMSLFAGKDGRALCRVVGPLFENPVAGQIKRQNRKLVDAYNNRIAKGAANAGSMCACSVHVVLQDRVPWAVYAGSLRLVKMSELDNLDARLTAALSSPLCAGVGQ